MIERNNAMLTELYDSGPASTGALKSPWDSICTPGGHQCKYRSRDFCIKETSKLYRLSRTERSRKLR